MGFRPVVDGLPLPELLVALVGDGKWVHPGDGRLLELIPFLIDPVDFLTTWERMAFESTGPVADDPKLSVLFHMARGSRLAGPLDLPWLDVDRSFFIAACPWPGDDVAIALDYRTDADDPRVLANDWESGRFCLWREVAPTFTSFVRLLALEG